MATSVLSLLTFPKTSDGLSAMRPTVIDSPLDDGSASPPRKVARLSTSSDSASASRNQGAATQKTRGPLIIQVTGDQEISKPASDKQVALIRRYVRVQLLRNRTSNDVVSATYETIYAACRSVVCVANAGEALYDAIKIELEVGIGNLSKILVQANEPPVDWLEKFAELLSWFDDRFRLIQSLLTYLDQVYVVQNRHVLSIHDLAYLSINERVFGVAKIAERLTEGLEEWLTMERETHKEHPKRQVFPTLVQHLLVHREYPVFEERYLLLTRVYYETQSARRREELQDNPKAFFTQAKTRIDEEISRAKAILPVFSWSIVRETTEQSLWKDNLQWLSNSLMKTFMDEKDFASLALVYTLFSRVEGVKDICSAFKAHLQNSVINVVKDAEQDDKMAQHLLDLRASANQAINTCFLVENAPAPISSATASAASTSELVKIPNQEFIYALNDAFHNGFKARRNKPAEMIAKYLDKLLRKGQGTATDDEFKAALDSALALYRYTDDKDVFRTFYHRSLAKRLLLDKSASDDFEKAMLKELKQKYDPEFGMAEDMFKDLALSKDLGRDWHSRLPKNHLGNTLNPYVLQRSAWPFGSQKNAVDLPLNMQEQLSKFTDYYKSKHSGRVLNWDHALGTGTLEGHFDRGTKTLSVSLYQTVVLLLFNDSPELSFADIKEQTNMELEELKRTVLSLSYSKNKGSKKKGRTAVDESENWDDIVLKKVPPGREIGDDDVFHFNPHFWDVRKKVHINSIQAKVTPEESRRTNSSIEEDRKLSLDAALVRIMKARKELTYEQLKAAAIEAVKSHFVPQVEMIKKRIDSLVEQDYLERHPEDRTRYMYVA